MRAADFNALSQVVRAESGMMLDPADTYAIEGRLAALAGSERLADPAAVVAALRQPDRALRLRVCEALTVNETRFFRDERMFEALSDHVLPQIAARHRDLAIWCAASASGQEPYSVAMVMRERGLGGRVLATDLSTAMVERTRAATYSEFEVRRGLGPARQARHLIAAGDRWIVRDEVRAIVDVAQRNLAAPWPAHPPFDVVLMRNVLVYLAPAVRAEVLVRTRAALAPEGVLVLGGSESGLVPGFDRIVAGSAVFYRSSRSHRVDR